MLIIVIATLILDQRNKRTANSEQLTDDKFEAGCDETFIKALANGANDVMVVKGKDGNFESTPWKAQVGKLYSILESRKGKLVSIFVNNVPARIKMGICDSGGLIFGRENNQDHMTSWELQELNLQPGLNKAKYVVDDMDIILDFNVFLYSEDDKLVITDIDGTITESDLKGQVLPQFGISAEHNAVVELFEKISQNGYHLVYLTARSMSQDEDTRSYLFSMLQNQSGFSLPPGPVIFSPVPFFTGLIAEVISKTPFVEKSKSIDEMNKIFVGDTIVGAYGNKETDTTAYQNSGIPLERVWIVNPAGDLKNEATKLVTSYAQQAEHVDELYPKLG